MRILIMISLAVAAVACGEKNETVAEAAPKLEEPDAVADTVEQTGPPPTPSYEITSDSMGFGYKIFLDGDLYVSQPHMPALPGKQGFESNEDAVLVAEYLITKIEQGIMPPFISIEELDSLGVLDHVDPELKKPAPAAPEIMTKPDQNIEPIGGVEGLKKGKI